MDNRKLLEKSILKIGEFQRFGSKPGLERVSALLARLDHPEKDLKVIHVGGTNGKGSVCRYVYSVLEEAGYRTGIFISPYIEEFTERIEFDGSRISPEDLYRITEQVTGKAAELVAEGQESPTEFEVLTAIAFCYFREKQADAVVLEVGLGGRGDSTNVVEQPLVSCIASVSFDHMDYLGNTLAEIAEEKAGIIKAGCPLVYAAAEPEVIRILEGRGTALGAETVNCAEKKARILEETPDRTVFSVEIRGTSYEGLTVTMPGRHQVTNAVCALEMLEILKSRHGFRIGRNHVGAGLERARQPGRIEILRTDPMVVLDGSHNADSVLALCRWIEGTFRPEDRLLMVTGVLRDKEYRKIGKMLAGTGADFIVTEPGNPRKLSAEEYGIALQRYLKPEQQAEILADPEAAAVRGMERLYAKEFLGKPYKALIFTGSLYMIGIVRKIIKGMITEVSSRDACKQCGIILQQPFGSRNLCGESGQGDRKIPGGRDADPAL